MFRIRPSAAWAVESLGLVCLRRIVECRPYQARSGKVRFACWYGLPLVAARQPPSRA